MSDSDVEYDASNVEIEELDVDEIDESVRSEFVELQQQHVVMQQGGGYAGPSTASAGASSSAQSESETDDENMYQREVLIKKLVAREISFSEYQAQIQQEDDLDDDDVDVDQSAKKKSTFFQDFNTARRDVLKGNFQGSTKLEGKSVYRRQKRCLPTALQGLMGQANLCYARGDVKTAEDLCMEIIRQLPLAHEPFITLAQIHEMTDPEKYLQYSLIAAHLNPSDSEQWLHVAEIFIERDDVFEALKCYTRGIRANPKNVDMRLKRARLMETKDEKQALRYYYNTLPFIPKEQSDLLISTAKHVAKKFHEESNVGAALDAMQRAYSTAPEKFSMEDINLLIELLIANGHYRQALDILAMHASVELYNYDLGASEDSPMSPNFSIVIPDNIVLDLRTKLAVVLVHLKCEQCFEKVIDDILARIDPENDGDCYLDVAEALMKEEYYRDALRLLVPLIKSKKFSLAAVWLRYADCSRWIENYDEAIVGYRKVVSLAHYLDARLALAALLKKQGKYDEALQALEQDPDNEYLDPEVLHERCLMLHEAGRYQELLGAGFILLARHCYQIKKRQDIAVLSHVKYYENKNRTLGEGVPDFVQGSDLPLETEWDLAIRLLTVADEQRDYTYYMKLVFTLQTSKRFHCYRPELLQLALTACIYNRDPTFGLNIMRDLIRPLFNLKGDAFESKINHPQLWNLFNLIVFISGDVRYHRYLSRIFFRSSKIGIYPKVLIANYHLNCCTFKYALNEYNKIYLVTNDPLHAMMIAVTLTQIACQKFTNKKQSLIAQANVFMEKYLAERPEEVRNEVFYNFGRMYHQLGLLHLAVDYYKRVLSFDSPVVRENPQYLDLKAEAAFNLSFIYKHSGNHDLARKYLYDYIQV
ncbi:general transcription factor 3C polypeptide 3 [Anopheles stephensi]|uniref:General transcription factor 3C polypeptide 3 n=1 Tax=Anopheles stephensi TaxID=30069 RepID=A0A182YLX4_ANOST|nr:general transcription factor 3C polypeptide 3 [Anopheles stephensi]